MKKLLVLILLVSGSYFLPSSLIAQQQATATAAMDTSGQIPVDPNVKTGTFKNGLTYYIRHNEKPKDEVQLRLIVRAGSILEKPDQLGLAHVMEHMNFNGTTHFKKNELVDYLQSIGVKFGADLNASTGFGRTLFILPLPTQDPKALEKGFQVLEDWAHEARLQPQQIDDERGVVLEEYRLGLGAAERMQKQYLPVILKGSRYAERLPIGTKENIEHFKYSSLRNFYHTWYRPDLMAVVAVGDLDVDTMYQKIKDHFAGIAPHKNAPERKEYSIPDHQQTYIAVATDSEATSSQVEVDYLDEGARKISKTLGDYRSGLVEQLFSEMINNRLDELRNSPNPPFVFASSSHSQFFSPNKEAYTSFAVTSQDGQLEGLKAVLEANKRVKEYGFEQDELDRAKKDLLASLKNQYKGRETLQSGYYVNDYVSNYLYGSPIAGISWDYDEAQKIVPEITLEEVSSLINNFLHQDNRSVLLTGPASKASEAAMKQKVQDMLAEVDSEKVSPYKSKAVRKDLMTSIPEKGSITKQTTNDQLGTTTLTLSNGAQVVYKKTDFKDNQILFQAFSYGGASLYSNEEYRKTALANNGLTEAGVGGLSKTDLQKVLAGKNVSVSPYISDLTEGLQGSTTPDDMESFFQLVDLYFTSLNKNPEAFQSYISKQKAQYANLLANPQFYFISQFGPFINNNNPRYVGVPTPQKLENADYDLAYKKYQQRFSNAGDFKFYFVGDIPVEEFKKDVETYIASLPSTSKREEYKVLPYRPLSGDHEKVVYKGQAPKSLVIMLYEGETTYTPKKAYDIQSLGDILTIKLTENLREKESGVYTVNATGSLSKIPYNSYSFSISFPCGPDNVPKLTKSALAEVQKIVDNGPTNEDLEKVKKNQLLNFKKEMKQNRFWLSNLLDADVNQTDQTAFLNYKSKVDALTKEDIQNVAKEYLTEGHITGILYPEKQDSSNKK